jgi:hypothetical protein
LEKFYLVSVGSLKSSITCRFDVFNPLKQEKRILKRKIIDEWSHFIGLSPPE